MICPARFVWARFVESCHGIGYQDELKYGAVDAVAGDIDYICR